MQPRSYDETYLGQVHARGLALPQKAHTFVDLDPGSIRFSRD